MSANIGLIVGILSGGICVLVILVCIWKIYMSLIYDSVITESIQSKNSSINL